MQAEYLVLATAAANGTRRAAPTPCVPRDVTRRAIERCVADGYLGTDTRTYWITDSGRARMHELSLFAN